MFFPIIYFIFQKLSQILEWGAYVVLIFGCIGAIGEIAIAIVPDNEDLELHHGISYGQVHDKIAITTMSSFFLTIVFSGVVLGYNDITKSIQVNESIGIGFLIAIILMVIVVGIQVKWALKCKADSTLVVFPGDGIYSFPLAEWTLFILLYVMIYWIALALL